MGKQPIYSYGKLAQQAAIAAPVASQSPGKQRSTKAPYYIGGIVVAAALLTV